MPRGSPGGKGGWALLELTDALHIVIKQLNKEKKFFIFFIMLKRNSFNVHCKFGACQK